MGLTIWLDHRGHSTPVTGHGVLVELSSNAVGLDMRNIVNDVLHTVYCVAHGRRLGRARCSRLIPSNLSFVSPLSCADSAESFTHRLEHAFFKVKVEPE